MNSILPHITVKSDPGKGSIFTFTIQVIKKSNIIEVMNNYPENDTAGEEMPDITGIFAGQRIRALDIPGAKTIPIITMTANVFREDVEKCIAAGMNSHVGKPLDFDEVINKLKAFLQK